MVETVNSDAVKDSADTESINIIPWRRILNGLSGRRLGYAYLLGVLGSGGKHCTKLDRGNRMQLLKV